MVTELNATKDNIYAVLAGILGGKWKVNGTSVFLDDPAGFSVGFARYTASSNTFFDMAMKAGGVTTFCTSFNSNDNTITGKVYTSPGGSVHVATSNNNWCYTWARNSYDGTAKPNYTGVCSNSNSTRMYLPGSTGTAGENATVDIDGSYKSSNKTSTLVQSIDVYSGTLFKDIFRLTGWEGGSTPPDILGSGSMRFVRIPPLTSGHGMYLRYA